MSTQAITTGTVETAPRSQPRHAPPAHLWAFLGYFVLALIVTYPTILHFTTQVPGELIADRDQHYWNFWWLSQAFSPTSPIPIPTNPLYTGMLYYPYGAPLYYHVLSIPLWLIGLIPQLVWGYPAAYNTVVIAAFTLSGYAAFRLALFITGRPLASFVGGLVFAFTPYTLGAVADGQNEVFSIQWIPLYAECWLRAWQSPTWRGRILPLSLSGLFFAAGGYTTLYYPVQLAVFTAVYIAYVLISRPDRRASLRRAVLNSGAVGAVALLLMAPLIAGLAANYNNPRLDIEAGESQMIGHSADLAGLVAFPHDHPLTGATRYGTEKLPVRDNLSLGWVALALAAIGAIISWRDPTRDTRFWVALALVAILLAVGPYLQLTATSVTSIPFPYKLLDNLPIFSGLGKVERFVVLARLSMSILAAWGALYIFGKIASKRDTAAPAPTPDIISTRDNAAARIRTSAFIVLVLLLLAELPLHPRYIEPFKISPGFSRLAQQPPGGLMELPFATQQNTTIGERMVYQTVHNHPIMAGYLSRNYNSPIIDSCSPFWGFIAPLGAVLDAPDIATPTVASRPVDVLNFFDVRYIALYSRYGMDGDPLTAEDTAAYRKIISRVSPGAPLYSDDYLSLYQVSPADVAHSPISFHIGDGWYPQEQSGDQPFRWMKESSAAVCLFNPRPTSVRASLSLQGTAYAKEHAIEIYSPSTPAPIFTGTLPAGGQFAALQTGLVDFPPGITQVRIINREPGTTPQSLDPNSKDNRTLTVGFRQVGLIRADTQR